MSSLTSEMLNKNNQLLRGREEPPRTAEAAASVREAKL